MYGGLILKGFLLIFFLSLTSALEDCKKSEKNVYKPVPFRCNQYIHCNSGRVSLKTCPFGTHFSPKQLKCIDKKFAGCGILSRSKRDTCPPNPTCSLFDNSVKKTYPPDCTRYTFCDAGTLTISSCPIGQEFSPTAKSCMNPATANCPVCTPEGLTTQPPATTTGVTATATATTTTDITATGTTATGITTTTTPPPPTCDPTPTCSIFDVNIKKVYPPDCKKYVYCDAGITTIEDCAIGFEFSPTQKSCMSASSAGCPYCLVGTTTTQLLTTTTTFPTTTTPTTTTPTTTTPTTTTPTTTTPTTTTPTTTTPTTTTPTTTTPTTTTPTTTTPTTTTPTTTTPTTTTPTTTTPTTTTPTTTTPTTTTPTTTTPTTTTPTTTTPTTTTPTTTTPTTTTPTTTTPTTTTPTTTTPTTTTPTTTTPTTTKPTTTTTTATTTKITTVLPTTTLPICPPIPTCSVGEVGVLKPFPPDCSKYLYCNAQNEALLRVCEDGNHFVESYQGCIIAAQANCVLCRV